MAAEKGDDIIVPNLQELAFVEFFDKLIHKLTPNAVQFVRNLIDAHLVGRVKHDFRYDFIWF